MEQSNNINTSNIDHLWEVYTRDNSIENRNKLINHYGYLAKTCAKMMHKKYKNYYDFDELFQIGNLGLIDAIRKFDITRHIKFDTYASIRIRGTIVDQIRKGDWVPRSVRDRYNIVEKAKLKLKESNMPLTYRNIEKLTQLSERQVKKAVLDYSNNVLLSVEEIQENGEIRNSVEMGSLTEDYIIKKDIINQLSKAIDKLSEKERLVISLSYYDELKLKDIAKVLELTDSRVSQIRKNALEKLKDYLNN